MKVIILAGGYGTRITDESQWKPKPMIEIGDMPILWHIMKGYAHYGFCDFIICASYKQHVVKDWFANFERDPLQRLTTEGQLMSYTHMGFWQCMDNLREKLWKSGQAPWKSWQD